MSGFDIGHGINSAAGWVSTAPVIGTVTGNAFYAALLITALIAAVLLYLYHDAYKEGGSKKAWKAFIYILLVTTLVMVVHHYAVTQRARRDRNEAALAGGLNVLGSTSSLPGDDMYAYQPAYTSASYAPASYAPASYATATAPTFSPAVTGRGESRYEGAGGPWEGRHSSGHSSGHGSGQVSMHDSAYDRGHENPASASNVIEEVRLPF